ncbi:MAG: EscU/YscU/HrcU family type III secretion system export apparatus switch protein [Sandaracinus sp.]
MSDEAKTEEPTPRREREARREGRAWQSRDLVLAAGLVALGGALRLERDAIEGGARALFEDGLARIAAGSIAPADAIASALSAVGVPVLAALGLLVVATTAASAIQLGGLVAPGALAPDARRLDPSARFGGTAAPRAASQLGMTLLRLASVGIAVTLTFREGLPGIATLSRQAPSAALGAALAMIAALLLRSGLALAAVGVLDAVVERAWLRVSLRMSRREVERERRETEGDAHVRRERARVREELARASDVEETRAAALLVTEGEALAIALAYDAADLEAVPVVTAIGRAEAAEAMREAARETGVPTIEDEPLAVALAIVPLGHPIPEAHYEPVARALRTGAP